MRLIRLAVLSLLALLLVAVPAALAQDGGELGVESMTFESLYPRGMEFTITLDSDSPVITRAMLFMTLRPGTRERHQAEFDPERQAWVALPYTDGGGLPPWVDFDYHWSLTDSAGNTYETEPTYAVYADNSREWQHVDTEDITLYWYGFAEDDSFGPLVAETMARMRPIFEEGFGDTLSYKPLAIIFPPGNAWDEYVSGGNNPDAAGFTNNGTGYTLQRLSSSYFQNQEWLEERATFCGGQYNNGRASTPQEWAIMDLANTIVHEVTHLYQSDFRVRGPVWFIEGEAELFSEGFSEVGVRSAANRLAWTIAQGIDLPTLQGEGPSSAVTTPFRDGCRAIGYNMGESFLVWLVENYGGLETHLRLLEGQHQSMNLTEALEYATGTPFLQLENEWRATLGLAPVAPLPEPTPFVLPTAPPMGGGS